MQGWLRFSRNVLLGLIILCGLSIALARLATPLLIHAKQPLERFLTEKLNTPVHIGSLQGEWHGAKPILQLKQVSIGNKGASAQLEDVLLDFTLDGLISKQPSDALRISLTGLAIEVVRGSNGQVQIQGLSGLQNSTSDESDFIPSRIRLFNTQVLWRDVRVNAKPIKIDNLNIELTRKNEQLTLKGKLDSELGKMDFAATLVGDLSDTEWFGESYLHIQKFSLADVFKPYIPIHYRLESGKADLEIWQKWNQAIPTLNQGNVSINNIVLSNTLEIPNAAAFKNINSYFSFERDKNNNWSLALPNLQLQQNNEATLTSRLAASISEQDQTLNIASDKLSLASLSDLLLIRPPSEEIHRLLLGLEPAGLLENTHLKLSLNNKEPRWALNTDVKDFSTSPWQGAPGINNFNADIAANNNEAELFLSSKTASVDYRSMFRDLHPIDHIEGYLYWQIDNNNWKLFSPLLTINTPHLKSQSRLVLTPIANNSIPHLSIQTDIKDGSVKYLSRYLPAAIMGENTLAWLDNSFIGGHIEKATLLLDGPLSDFPFSEMPSGVFEVAVLARDTGIDYQAGWPVLHDLDATLLFHQLSLDIDLIKGSIYNSTITRAHASISDLFKTSPLTLNGHIKGSLKDQLTLLQEDALKDDFGHFAKALTAKGESELDIKFTLPLDVGIGKHDLTADLQFNRAKLQLKEWDLNLTNIKGKLAISLDSLSANNIQAQAFGSPIKLKVAPKKDTTHVLVTANLSEKAVAQQLKFLPVNFATGAANFDIDIAIPNKHSANDSIWLAVSSDLKGMQINLPAPLGKPKSTQKPISVKLAVSGKPQNTSIQYAEELSAEFSPDWTRADIRFATGAAELGHLTGYAFSANLKALDITAWRKALASLLPQNTQQSNIVWQADINAKKVLLGDIQFNGSSIKIARTENMIKGNISSQQLAGRFTYSNNSPATLKAELSKLYISLPDKKETHPIPKSNDIDPRLFPNITLSSKELRINEANFGLFHFESTTSANGLAIKTMSAAGESNRADISGYWNFKNGRGTTNLKGNLRTVDIGQMLHDLQFSRQLEEASAAAVFDFKWPGGLNQFHKKIFTGSAQLAVSKGRLSSIDPGISRIFGLLSLDALTRRLTFDFGDIFKEGYSFDSIKGDFNFIGADANTRNLVLDGPAGTIEVGGRIGLIKEDIEQFVMVTPKLDATLPLISTLTAGPIAGIATIIAQKLLSDEVDDVNRFEYSVSGSLDDPIITPLDSGGALSTIVNTLSGEETEKKTDAQHEMIQSDEKSSSSVDRLLNEIQPKPPVQEPSEEESTH